MNDQERQSLTRRLKDEARRLGFDGVGIAPAVAPPGYGDFLDWLARGRQAGMGYMERAAEVRGHPDRLRPGVRSVIVVSVVYGEPQPAPTSPRQGRIARYARGADYHEVLWRKLEELLRWLRAECPGVEGRAVADTAPLLERDFARLAGLGWIAKNTMLIDKRLGSFTFLGALLVDLELIPDPPHEADHCGTCTRCLDACPTRAFPAPYQLDARRCISYWTIEHKGAIPEEVAEGLHGWAFGCDICQDVCPWNRKASAGALDALRGRDEWNAPDLIEWLTRDRSAWAAALKGTALKRTKRAGLLRNAALILGARRVEEAAEALAARLGDVTEDPTVREAAAWALGRLATSRAIESLMDHRDDPAPEVAEAVRRALDRSASTREAGAGEGFAPPPGPGLSRP
jgi:epoxyqueuosine reductase